MKNNNPKTLITFYHYLKIKILKIHVNSLKNSFKIIKIIILNVQILEH